MRRGSLVVPFRIVWDVRRKVVKSVTLNLVDESVRSD